MALDAIFLAAVVEELRSAICGGRIDKIYQPSTQDVVTGSSHHQLHSKLDACLGYKKLLSLENP